MNANSLEKEWKPLKNSCYPLEKERNEKKSEIFHSKKSEKRVRVNTSEHHSKMYCPLFNSLKNGHSLAESERHSFSSEYSIILLILLTNWHSLVFSLFLHLESRKKKDRRKKGKSQRKRKPTNWEKDDV